MVQYKEMNYKNKANTITIDQAKEDYKELIAEAIDKKMWLKCRNIKNVWVSPFEIQEAWLIDKYLWPVSYWELVNGEYDKLMLSFEWAWLQEYFKSNYNTAQHQL